MKREEASKGRALLKGRKPVEHIVAAGRTKKTILGIAALMIMSLLLQSCFEIKEIITINKDGSGTFSMIIDMSEVKAMLESFNEEDSDQTDSPLGEMEKDYEITLERGG